MTPRLKFASVLAAACLLIATARGQPYVEDSINVYHSWVGSMCYNRTTDVVYGASEEGVIFAISCSLNQVISRVYAHGPLNVAYDAADNKAYCTVYNDVFDSVLVIDGATHTRLRAIPLDWATDLVWDSTDDRIWVTLQETDEVACIDCATDSVIARVPVGDCPLKLYLNTRHRKLYVLNNDGESVTIVDIAGNQVLRTIPLGNVPDAGTYCESVGKCYCGAGNVVTVIDGSSDSAVGYIRTPLGSGVLAMTDVPATGLIMFGTYGGGPSAVYSVDTETDSVVSVLPVGGVPEVLFWSSRTDLVYCAGYGGLVTVIADDGARIVETLPVASNPSSFAYSPVRGRLYVGHASSRWVFVIRDSAAAVREGASGNTRRNTGVLVRPSVGRGPVVVEYDVGELSAPAVLIHARDGRLVRSLAPQPLAGGRRRAVWDGQDARGCEAPPGVYFVSAGTGGDACAKIVKLK
jgi:YVTN family beta-propeller protein